MGMVMVMGMVMPVIMGMRMAVFPGIAATAILAHGIVSLPCQAESAPGYSIFSYGHMAIPPSITLTWLNPAALRINAPS